MNSAQISFVFYCVVAAVLARPQAGGGAPSAGMPALPPQVEAVLPAETVAQIKEVHTDTSLAIPEKQEKIDKIMVSLPTEVLDKIPLPPGFEQLPEEVQSNIKTINRNREKTWAEKQQELHQYIQTLPAQQKALLMGPPPPSMQG